MPGEMFQISCACGVNGYVQLGSTNFDDFLDVALLRAGIPKTEKYKYFTIDNQLTIQSIESTSSFEPLSSDIITDEKMV